MWLCSGSLSGKFKWIYLNLLRRTGLAPFHQTGGLRKQFIQRICTWKEVSIRRWLPLSSRPPAASLRSKFPICRLAFCIDVNAAKFISKFLLNFHFHLTTGPQQAPWRNETRVEAAFERAVTLLHLARINLPVKANCVNLRYSELYSFHVLHDIFLWAYHEAQCNRLETC